MDALAFAAQAGTLTRADYMDITGVRPLTATRDLGDLVQRGFLVAHGRTRGRTYSVSEPGDTAARDNRQSQLPL
jgi:Fic family protein